MFNSIIKIPWVRKYIISWLLDQLIKYAQKRYKKWRDRIDKAEQVKKKVAKLDEEIEKMGNA